MTRKTKATDKQAGQGLVEFALILPVLLLLMFGVIEFGRLLFIYTEVSNAAREAVRFGVVLGDADDPNYERCGRPHSMYGCEICDAGNGAAVLTNLADADFTIVIDDGDGGEVRDCLTSDDYHPNRVEGDIDRLVVTVSHDVRPLVLFQDAGPFQIQFTAARTLVYEGVSMSGFGDVPAGNPHLFVPEGFHFESDSAFPAGCCGYFSWSVVENANAYAFHQWLPVQSHITTTLGLEYPLPTAACMDVQHEDIYYVQAQDSYEVWDPSPPSNYAVINCLSQPEDFRYEPELSCDGGFRWTEGEYADGYHLYTPIMSYTIEAPHCPGGTCRYDLELTTTGPFTLTAYNSVGDGLPSSIEVPGCTNPLDSPILTWDGACSPATFAWPPKVSDAFGYRVYEATAGLVSGDLPSTTLTYSQTVANGEQYQVVPYNTAGPSGPSNVVSVKNCGGAEDITYYLHTTWPVTGCLDHTEPLTLPMNMDEDPRTCRQYVYDYDYDGVNPAEPPAGREVPSGGYLLWQTKPLEQQLTITGTVTLHLWFINPSKTNLQGSIDLLADAASLLSPPATVPLGKDTFTWTEVTVPLILDIDPATVGTGSELVLSVTNNGPDESVWFIYDKGEWFLGDGYQSRIEFEGKYE